MLVFDGDCAFCTMVVDQVRRLVRPRATIVAWQHADLGRLGLTAEACRASVQWVPGPGVALSRGSAVTAVLRAGRGPWPVVGRVLQWPLVRLVTDAGYRVVAANRYRLPGSTPACQLPQAVGTPAGTRS